MKVIVIMLLIAIFISLFSALFFLFRDRSGSTRTVKALTYRISISIGLFVLLIAAHFFGLIGKRL